MIFERNTLFRAVCNIRTPQIQNGVTFENVGTGIFITNGEQAWILTAEHIAKETNNLTYVILCDNDTPTTKNLLALAKDNAIWKCHDKADIAILELDIAKNQEILKNKCLGIENMELQYEKTPTRDDELTAVGFPKGYGAAGKFCPFTFRSYPASDLITLPRFDTNEPCEFFCLEHPATGGYSGGPVFDIGIMRLGGAQITKENTTLYGIIHGTISDKTGGKIAAVTPIYFLKDLL